MLFTLRYSSLPHYSFFVHLSRTMNRDDVVSLADPCPLLPSLHLVLAATHSSTLSSFRPFTIILARLIALSLAHPPHKSSSPAHIAFFLFPLSPGTFLDDSLQIGLFGVEKVPLFPMKVAEEEEILSLSPVSPLLSGAKSTETGVVE